MPLAGRWRKKGLICRAENVADWWDSSTMAPAPIDLGDGRLRVFVGAWKTGQSHPVSRIGYVDVAADCPAKVLAYSSDPVAEIGAPGTYNDSGVFPAHVARLADGAIYLYTTGFQHSTYPDVDHLHTSGLLCSADNGDTFQPYSLAPVLDRADEGLHLRAGLSICADGSGEGYHSVYAVGAGFQQILGKRRISYEICYQHTKTPTAFAREGRKIIAVDPASEYAWGRPQITRMQGQWVVIAAVRLLSGFYHIGCATSTDLLHWEKQNDWARVIAHGEKGDFDDQMIYYPAICTAAGKTYLFYSGNGFGRGGLGYAELQ